MRQHTRGHGGEPRSHGGELRGHGGELRVSTFVYWYQPEGAFLKVAWVTLPRDLVFYSPPHITCTGKNFNFY